MSLPRACALCLALLVTVCAVAGHPGGDRYYCTEYAPFFIRIDGEKLAGVFAVLERNDLGTAVGELHGNVMTGRWHEADASGDIVIRFAPDRSAFSAEYRVDGEPDIWHREWRGVLRYADGDNRFTLDEIEYRCE